MKIMTREEFEEDLRTVSAWEYDSAFGEEARELILNHDSAQRLEIERLVKLVEAARNATEHADNTAFSYLAERDEARLEITRLTTELAEARGQADALREQEADVREKFNNTSHSLMLARTALESVTKLTDIPCWSCGADNSGVLGQARDICKQALAAISESSPGRVEGHSDGLKTEGAESLGDASPREVSAGSCRQAGIESGTGHQSHPPRPEKSVGALVGEPGMLELSTHNVIVYALHRDIANLRAELGRAVVCLQESRDRLLEFLSARRADEVAWRNYRTKHGYKHSEAGCPGNEECRCPEHMMLDDAYSQMSRAVELAERRVQKIDSFLSDHRGEGTTPPTDASE